MSPAERRRYVSIAVAAEYLGIHRRTLERWLEEDPPRITYRDDGPRHRLVDVASIVKYDSGRRREAEAS